MNSENKFLIKNSLDDIIKKIRNSINELYLKNNPIELNHNILKDYYSLITNNISNYNITIYILHLISQQIKNSFSLLEKNFYYY